MELAYLAISADGSVVADGCDEYEEVVQEGLDYIGSYTPVSTMEYKDE